MGKQVVVNHSAEIICAVLLLLMSINLLGVISRKSITTDEIVMIPAAYYHLAAGNSQLVLEHPPLVKIVAALPLLFIQPNEIPPAQVVSVKSYGDRTWYYQQMFWNDNRARFETISFWSRVPMIAFAVILGVVIFLFARKLFGTRSALLAVALYSLEPTVLAHSRVVQTDVPAALGYLLVALSVFNYVLNPESGRALWIGLASGLALIAKFSMIILGPVLLVAVLIWLWIAPKRGLKRTAIAIHVGVASLASLLIINAAYFFQGRVLDQRDIDWVTLTFPSSHQTILSTLPLLSKLVPTDYILGIYWQLSHFGEGHPASLLGMHSREGWWYYFPVAFSLKTTIPFLVLAVTGTIWASIRLLGKREQTLLVVIIPLAIYTAFVMTSRINIGIRYFLPALPFLFMLGGTLLDRLLRFKRAPRVGMTIALGLFSWMGVEAIRAYPNHMSYLNQLASQHPPWYYLSDSNVEWGDEVGELAAYLRERGETRIRATLLGGFVTLNYYGVEYLDAMTLPEVDKPETRYVAIGASFLNGSTVPGPPGATEEQRVNYFDVYRRRTPEAVFGNSIYLYRMSP
jgi:4-amino-4-deoxy-L-arabinose transferase-like glycosyltransferase